jgi:hypothetical protein
MKKQYTIHIMLKDNRVISKEISEVGLTMMKESINASKKSNKITYQLDLGDEIVKVADIINFEYEEKTNDN